MPNEKERNVQPAIKSRFYLADRSLDGLLVICSLHFHAHENITVSAAAADDDDPLQQTIRLQLSIPISTYFFLFSISILLIDDSSQEEIENWTNIYIRFRLTDSSI